MERLGTRDRGTVHVVDEDPALLGTLERPLARRELIARELSVRTGAWKPLAGDLPRAFDGWLGLLVLDGLLVRETQVNGLRCSRAARPRRPAAPVGRDRDGGDVRVDRALARARADPDRAAGRGLRAARRPAGPRSTAELMHRTLARSRSLSVLLALTQARRADVRLRTLFCASRGPLGPGHAGRDRAAA